MKARKECPGPAGDGSGHKGKTVDQQDTLPEVSCQSTSVAAQRRRILDLLRHGSLTTLGARAEDIMHPAARCMELRKQGHPIRTEWAVEYCAGGVKHRVASYRLAPGNEVEP
ncbi:helix-turn-helix domain-containing protein [Desulfobulbus sp.]|uniref:helix-turn-helix domain-containing protein n=1 Tax=Desulfobulbus sp. TaxID=895 RepID=UPI00286F3DEB|nr:helix-turn-helix domain-containing protein [Desulfobulbus sp.]